MTARPSAYATVFLLMLGLLTAAPAQTFTVLHTFKGAPTDGASPLGALILDKAGNVYGTTGSGGSGKDCPDFTFGCGTAFMLDKTGKEIALHSFDGPNGAGPQSGLMRDTSGNLYGTTNEGGNYTGEGCSGGCGVAFRLSRTGQEIFYQFRGVPDGFVPAGVPVEDSDGIFMARRA